MREMAVSMWGCIISRTVQYPVQYRAEVWHQRTCCYKNLSSTPSLLVSLLSAPRVSGKNAREKIIFCHPDSRLSLTNCQMEMMSSLKVPPGWVLYLLFYIFLPPYYLCLGSGQTIHSLRLSICSLFIRELFSNKDKIFFYHFYRNISAEILSGF